MPQTACQTEPPDLDPGAFDRIADLVFRHTGIRLGPGKAYFVVGRLAGLYQSLGCRRWDELPDRFEQAVSPAVREALVQAVVTPETSFFRDDLPFRALRERIVPELAATALRPVPVRVWSAGCSTGQEPYSIVMSLWDRVESGQVDLSVWATDLSGAALDRARAGRYHSFELDRGLDAGARRRFFEELPGGTARVRESLRGRIRFDRLNLTAPAVPAESFHAVFCRNVAIYFDREGKRRLYESLGSAVKPGGYLVLGAAETLFPGVPGFETVYFERSLLFRKVPGGSR